MDFLKEVNGSLVNTAAELNIYVDKEFFDDGLAVELGESIRTIGLFYVGVKTSPTSKEIIHRVTIPANVRINFSNRFQSTNAFEGKDPVDFECARLGQGDIFMYTTDHVQSIDSCTAFLRAFNLAKIPSTVPYDDLVGTYKGAGEYNGIGFGVPSLIVEIIISELCRNTSDTTQPFRLVAGTGKAGSYKMIPIKKIAEVSSVFNAISFENLNQAIQSSISMTRSGKKQRVSPVEKTIFY
jgi:hypothetical protein